MNYYNQLISVYTFNNIGLIIASAITFGIGFWEYIYSFRLILREGSAPFPIWMHTFYFAHDSTWAVVLFIAASKYHWHWFFLGASIALVVWTLFELFNLYKAVKVERNEIWNVNYTNGITEKQAMINILVQIVAFIAIVNIFREFMGNGSVLQWFAMTNVVMAAGPGILWKRRGSRSGSSVGLSIVILLGTIITFLPCGMFVLALPDVFNKPWFYITGVVFTAISASNIIMMLKYPKKELIKGEKKPIW
jgi:hypothetical protein